MKKIISLVAAGVLFACAAFAKPITTITAGLSVPVDFDGIGGEVAANVSLHKSDIGQISGVLFTEIGCDFFDSGMTAFSVNLGYGLYNPKYLSVEVAAGINYVVDDKLPSVVFTWRLGKSIYNFGRLYLGCNHILRNSKCESILSTGVQLPICF